MGPLTDAVTTTLRYANGPISEADWTTATILTDNLPGSATTFAAVIPYQPGDTAYFALKSQNSLGEWSGLSNNASWPSREVYLPLVLK